MGTVLVIVSFALLPLLTPWFMHRALDAAGSAERLGLSTSETHAASDQTVQDLLLGGGFDLALPDGKAFFDADERRHLGDARLLLGLTLTAGGISLLGLAAAVVRWPARRRATWTVIRRAGLATAITVVVLGFVSLVAFDSLFTLFHQVFFPGGNWSFDPSTQRIVQLYPFRFWQVAAAALGALVVVLGLGTWLLGRWASTRALSPIDATPDPSSG